MRTEKTLEKKTKQIEKKTINRGMSPFTERPSENPATDASSGKTNLAATDLFSLFTADIIREQKLFTR